MITFHLITNIPGTDIRPARNNHQPHKRPRRLRRGHPLPRTIHCRRIPLDAREHANLEKGERCLQGVTARNRRGETGENPPGGRRSPTQQL